MKSKRIITILSIVAGATILACAYLILESNIRITIPLTASRAGNYEIYKLDLPAGFAEGEADLVELVLKDSEVLETKTVDGISCVTYTFGNISDYLYGCRGIVEVATLNNALYITYITITNKEVNLCYESDSFLNMTIYDEEKDECVAINSDGSAEKYTNYRYGWFASD